METTFDLDKAQILHDNLDYTLFSWSKQTGLNPLNIERAAGVYLWDRDGRHYLDFSSQLMNVNIGHGDQRGDRGRGRPNARGELRVPRHDNQGARRPR